MPDHPDQQFQEHDIVTLVQELQQEYAQHIARLRVRRLLIEMAAEARNTNATGTNIPDIFKESKLLIQTMIGDAVDAVQHYTSRIAANPPQVVVPSVVTGKEKLTKRAEDSAADQERILTAMWNAAGGRDAQWQVAWSQSWGRGGWYLTLPREAAWGLPERRYFDDLTDDEIEALKRDGVLAATMLEDGKGKLRHAEAAGSWFDRQRAFTKDNAVSGRSLFTLEALGPDEVLPRRDADGVKYVAIVQDVPSSYFRSGSELAQAAAEYDGIRGDDIGKYGLYLNKDGRMEGGVTAGGEPDSHQSTQSFTLTRFVTRSEIYYLVSASGRVGQGKVIWYENHGADEVPVVWVPAIRTDSDRPGAESSSPLESVFALTPIINQLETLLSLVASYNATPRWIVETTEGNLVRDPLTGDPLMVGKEPTVGLDPKDAQPVAGRVRQLVIEADILERLLIFYSEQLRRASPRGVTPEAVGSSAPAWNVRQFITEEQQTLQQPVTNNAAAVQVVMRIWVRWMRQLDVPVMMFAIPGERADQKSRRGMIEFEPADLVETLHVSQDSNTASDRIVLQQAGIELLESGRIDDHEYFETYALAADPEEAELRSYVQAVKRFVLLGDTRTIQEGSVLFNVANAVQGRVFFELMEKSPNMALAQAEQMAAQALEAAAVPSPERGNVAEVIGARQAGIGASLTQPGSAGGGAASVPPAPPILST